MQDNETTVLALSLIAEWAKWLVTIETFAIALVGSLLTSDKLYPTKTTRIFGTVSIISFGLSICFAATLLLTLPEIAQFLDSQTNVWMTGDSVVEHVFGLNTQDLALAESFLFASGVIFAALTIIAIIWKGK